jgi:hypothetical protein
VLQQTAELFDSGSPTHEELHSTRIANQIRFVFFCNPYFPRLRTYGTKEHRLAVDSYHQTSVYFLDFGGDRTIMHPTHAACRAISKVSFEGFGKVGIPEWGEPQINFLAYSLAGRGAVAPRSSRDICDRERARAKRAHHIVRYEFYVECSCGYKGRSQDHGCPECGAGIFFPVASIFGLH